MYLIIPSYPSLFLAVDIFLKGEDITIVTSNKNIQKVASELGIPCVFKDFYRNRWSRFIMRFSLVSFISSLDKSKDIQLCDDVYCIEGFFLLSRWRRNGCYFNNLSYVFEDYKKPIFFADILKLHVLRFVWGIEFCYKNVNGRPALGVNHRFFDLNGIKYRQTHDYNDLKISVVKRLSLKVVSADHLFVLQGDLKGIIKTKSLRHLNRVISEVDSMVIKSHPRFSNSFEFTGHKSIPDHLPVELCLGGIKQSVVSIFSTVLITASYHSSLCSISLLDLVDWEDEEYRESVRGWLVNESRSRIIFPKTLSDLWPILKI